MGGRRANHQLIANESRRKVTFKKRKAGLLKKLKEFTTLCGVMACAIIFNDYQDEPDIWPSPAEAFLVLEELKNLPKRKQGKYMMDQEVFLRNNISKLNLKLGALRKKNRTLELELICTDCVAGKEFPDLIYAEDLNDTINMLKEMVGFITNKIEHVKDINKEK